MRLLIVSDNHGDQEILDNILSSEKYDLAIHCGDAQIDKKYLDMNFDYWVPGNNDFYNKDLELNVDIGGLNTLICHGHTLGVYVFTQNEPIINLLKNNHYDLIIHGHTHIFRFDKFENTNVICPGSTSLSRGPEGNGYVLVDIESKKIKNVIFKKI